MPPAGASTGRPAASAMLSVGASRGSTPIDLDAALVPGGDAADQPAAADRDQQRVEVGRLLLELEADAARAQHGLDLVEGVDRTARPLAAI